MYTNLSNAFQLSIIVQEKAKILKWYINLDNIQDERFYFAFFFFFRG